MSEKIQPVSNPQLRRAMEAMHGGENGREQQMITLQLLLCAQLIAPVKVIRGEETQVQFQLLTTPDGRTFLPAFTDLAQMHKGFEGEDQMTLVVTFADLARMVLKDNAATGVVVDAFDASLTLERPLVEYLEKIRLEQEKNQPPVKS